jgi:hypothetical protein
MKGAAVSVDEGNHKTKRDTKEGEMNHKQIFRGEKRGGKEGRKTDREGGRV